VTSAEAVVPATVATAVLLDDQDQVGAAAPGWRVAAAVMPSLPLTTMVAPSGATLTEVTPGVGTTGSGGLVTVTSSPQAARPSTRPVHRYRLN